MNTTTIQCLQADEYVHWQRDRGVLVFQPRKYLPDVVQTLSRVRPDLQDWI